MTRVALIGAGGFVGKAIAKALRGFPDYDVVPVERENYAQMQGGSYDILINCAMPSARFWAKNNPADDFLETVEKTANLLYNWQFKKFVQISTVSARCQLDTVYGRHKAAAEAICGWGDNLIVRLSAMYGEGLEKGVLIDVLQEKKVFVDGKSRYSFAPLEFVASWIAGNLGRSGIAEVGAKNSLALEDIAKHLGGKIEFEGPPDIQEIQDPEDGFPDARDVLNFLDTIKKTKYHNP